MAASPPDLTLKAHDTFPSLKVTLSDTNGSIDLSTASQVNLVMKNTTTSATSILVTGAMTIASAVGGYCTRVWASKTETAYPDTYNVEFEIFWSAGGVETVPNDIYRQILIVQDLDNT